MAKIKICGITNLNDALLSTDFGADQLGFNFYRGCARYIVPEKAAAITATLPRNVIKVGVFVNESVPTICDIAELTLLDAVQLHGNESVEYVSILRKNARLTIIKALAVGPRFEPWMALDYDADAILLDAYSAHGFGGTGMTFNWDVAQQVRTLIGSLYLAGGLSERNVRDAIKTVRPYAVDACSNLESSPGIKDPKKLRRFIKAAKSENGL